MSLLEGVTQSDENSVRVLLVGFLKPEQYAVIQMLAKISWNAAVSENLDESFALFLQERFDLCIIDVDNIALYAPTVVAKARTSGGASANATILAVGDYILPGLKAQLMRAGVDLILQRPHDPKLYIPNFVRAASLRLLSVGFKRNLEA